jgi:hypothetical protein
VLSGRGLTDWCAAKLALLLSKFLPMELSGDIAMVNEIRSVDIKKDEIGRSKSVRIVFGPHFF